MRDLERREMRAPVLATEVEIERASERFANEFGFKRSKVVAKIAEDKRL